MSTEVADNENAGEINSSPLYKHNPLWKDVTPIYPSKAENAAVRIACGEEFTDAFAYLRAVLVSGEMSDRVFDLTSDCIQLNAANYTLWQLRRDLLQSLKKDLKKELQFLDDIIIENPKNYQVWHHRRAVIEWVGESLAAGELAFTADILGDESKNYHAWQHRQWLVRRFSLAGQAEMDYSMRLLLEDPRNNSAWNYRYFILQLSGDMGTVETQDVELNLAKKLIEKMPHNECVWNYMAGMLLENGVSSRQDVVEFVEDLYERTEPSARSPFLVSFLVDILLERIEKGEEAVDNSATAHKLLAELTELDPVRHNFWKYERIMVENAVEKQHLDKAEF